MKTYKYSSLKVLDLLVEIPVIKYPQTQTFACPQAKEKKEKENTNQVLWHKWKRKCEFCIESTTVHVSSKSHNALSSKEMQTLRLSRISTSSINFTPLKTLKV